MPSDPKPRDYHARRARQNAARSRGEVPECGRDACHATADPAWVNRHTPLLYCGTCAHMINRYNPGLCSPESDTPPLRPRRGRSSTMTNLCAGTGGGRLGRVAGGES